MHRYLLILFFLFPITSFCQDAVQHKEKIAVGYIEFNPELDDPAFKVCNDTLLFPYYNINTSYKGGQRAIRNFIFSNYKSDENSLQSGFIVIRFIINCKGESDRFRIEQLDKNFQQTSFSKESTDQLLDLTKKLKDWKPGKYKEITFDSIYYLSFKIVDGKLVDLTP